MRSTLVIVRVLALAALAACQGYGPTTVDGSGGVPIGSGGGGGTGGNHTVTITDNRYTPAAITIDSGAVVTWIWAGTNPHSVTFDAAGPSDIGIQVTGQASEQFNVVGTFPYHCLVHGTAMQGVITVQ